MIEVKEVKAGFGKKEILHDLSLVVPEGKITAIIGQSGCGKTTLLKTLNRIIEEEGGYIHGNIMINGQDIMKMNRELLRKRVGIVFQQPTVFPHSIEKNLSYVLKYHYHFDRQTLHERCVECLKQSGLYEEVKGNLSMPASRLSGGQKQRLAIARSLCVEPEILLLDEPCSALDMKNTAAIEDMLLKLRGKYTIVIVTHNLAQAKRIADMVVFMDQGRILEMTEKEQFFEHPVSDPARDQIQYM